jgi:hypothetical protein
MWQRQREEHRTLARTEQLQVTEKEIKRIIIKLERFSTFKKLDHFCILAIDLTL